MGNLGTVCLILLFSMWFVMYVGTMDSAHPLGTGFIQFITSIVKLDAAGLMQQIINNIWLTGPTAVLTALAAYLISASVGYSIRITVIVATATTLFSPFSGFMGELGACLPGAVNCIPVEVMYLVQGFFSLMLFLAVLAYTTGGEF